MRRPSAAQRRGGTAAEELARWTAIVALAACKGHAAAPPSDAAVAMAATPVAPPKRLPPLPDAERAALTGHIEVAAGKEGAFRIVSIDPHGGAPPKDLTPPGASYFPVPGAASLALATTDHGDQHTEQLVQLGATPADARPIGPSASHLRSPCASRDGKLILFEADTSSFRDVYELANGVVTRLTDNPEGNFEPSLAPDGDHLAFTSSRDGQTEIYTMSLTGAAQTRLTISPKDDWLAAWSPDDNWIAFLSERDGPARVYLMHPDGSAQHPAHGGAQEGEEQEPTWSPDARSIEYTVSTLDGASEVWVADVATGDAHRVSQPGARDEVPSWAPDSQHLVYVSTRDQRIDLYIARADGTAESRLTDSPEEEWIPRWRP